MKNNARIIDHAVVIQSTNTVEVRYLKCKNLLSICQLIQTAAILFRMSIFTFIILNPQSNNYYSCPWQHLMKKMLLCIKKINTSYVLCSISKILSFL